MVDAVEVSDVRRFTALTCISKAESSLLSQTLGFLHHVEAAFDGMGNSVKKPTMVRPLLRLHAVEVIVDVLHLYKVSGVQSGERHRDYVALPQGEPHLSVSINLTGDEAYSLE